MAKIPLEATATVTGRVWGNAWGTTRVRMFATSANSAKPSGPAVCSVRFEVNVAVYGTAVTVPKRSWAVVRSSASGGGRIDGVVGVERSDLTGFAVKPWQSTTRLIAPGTYTVGGKVDSRVDVEAGSITEESSWAGANMAVDVIPVGTLRTQRGTALRFVRTGHRDCIDHKVRVRLSSSLPRRAKRLTVYVNGDKRAVLTGRELRRSSVVVRRIAPRSYGVVRAVVLRKSGARNTMQATSWPCR